MELGDCMVSMVSTIGMATMLRQESDEDFVVQKRQVTSLKTITIKLVETVLATHSVSLAI